MQIVFKMNLGSRDAESKGLDFAKCTKGSELHVSDDVGAWLVSRGVASESGRQVHGVSPSPAIGQEVKPTIKAEPATAKAKQASNKE
jgi:hypothetical protein